MTRVLLVEAQTHRACAFWDAGAQVFINRGINGRWRDVLTPTDVAECEARAMTIPPGKSHVILPIFCSDSTGS